jgi:hypothetical protein
VLAAVAFVIAERRASSPMLHLPLLRHPSFAVANLAAFMVQYAFVGIAFAQVLWFEQVRDATILSTALRLLPLMGVYVITSWPAGKLARRFGFKLTIIPGLVLVAIGVLAMTQQTPATGELTTAVLMGIVGVGCGLSLPSTIAAAVISVPHTEAGMASASVNMFRQIGSALGAAVTGTIITTGIASRLPTQLAEHHIPAASRAAITRAVVDAQRPHGLPAQVTSAIAARRRVLDGRGRDRDRCRRRGLAGQPARARGGGPGGPGRLRGAGAPARDPGRLLTHSPRILSSSRRPPGCHPGPAASAS